MKLYFFLISITLLSQLGLAQTTDTSITKHSYITARLHKGFVLPHHKNMMYFIEDFTSGFELNYGRRNFDTNNWESHFNFPEIGLGVYYSTFGNQDVYGQGYALFPYLQFNLLRLKKLSFQNKLAMGLGYATKPFNIETNNYNTTLGSHFNVYIGLGLNADYRISKQLSLSVTTDLNHMSNGAVRKPNNGINVITGSIGAKYHLNQNPTPQLNKTPPPPSLEREILIVGSAGRSQSTTFNTDLYMSYSVSVNYLWHKSANYALGIGLDQFYSEALPYTWDAYGTEKDNQLEINNKYSAKDNFFNGVFVSYNLKLHKTTMFANLGAYLMHSIKPIQPIYPRIGARYQISNHLVTNFSIKAGFVRSEFLELGLGYRFHPSKKKTL